MVYLLVFLSVFISSCSCSKGRNEFGRVSIAPAWKGAPDFSDQELIREDQGKQKVRYEVSEEELNTLPADKLILKAWGALGAGAFDVAIQVSEKVLERFREKAISQQKSLSGQFPKAGKEKDYAELNACGAAFYVIAESYEKQGQCEKAIEFYKKAIKEFPLSQNWDPRGWYWKIADEAKAKIEKLEKSGCNEKR